MSVTHDIVEAFAALLVASCLMALTNALLYRRKPMRKCR